MCGTGGGTGFGALGRGFRTKDGCHDAQDQRAQYRKDEATHDQPVQGSVARQFLVCVCVFVFLCCVVLDVVCRGGVAR